MKKAENKCRRFMIVLVLFITACANMPSTAFTNHDEKFTKIKLGDQRQQVESIWGKAEPETEIYPTAHFEILNYEDKQGRPFAFFTINPNTQEVFAKSKWIYSDDSQYNLKDLFENQFKDVQWTTYFPCSTRGQKEEILINHEQGLYIAAVNDHADIISWMKSELVSIIVDGLYKKCPQLQPK